MREGVFRNQPADRREAAKAAMAKYVITISTMDNTQTWLLTGCSLFLRLFYTQFFKPAISLES